MQAPLAQLPHQGKPLQKQVVALMLCAVQRGAFVIEREAVRLHVVEPDIVRAAGVGLREKHVIGTRGGHFDHQLNDPICACHGDGRAG